MLKRNVPAMLATLALVAAPSMAWACGPMCDGVECFPLYAFISLFVTWIGSTITLIYMVVAHRKMLGWLRMFWYSGLSWVLGALVLSGTFCVLDVLGHSADNDWWALAAFAQSIVVQVGFIEWLTVRFKTKHGAS